MSAEVMAEVGILSQAGNTAIAVKVICTCTTLILVDSIMIQTSL